MKKIVLDPKPHIEKLFQQRARNDLNSVTLANTLNKDIETLFKGPHKFIFELLQNADDAGESKQPVAVEFILLEDHLIFRHNGQPFTPEDVEKICDNAQQRYLDKIENPHKTGYKGIGFKALFNVADSVGIISGGYQFRFDKPYWAEESKDKPYPWPIIPIWTELTDFKPTVRSYLNNKKFPTAFVLSLKRPQAVADEFDFMQKTADWMLFFRRVRSIALYTSQKHFSMTLQVKDNQRQIYQDGELKKTFIVSPIFFWKIPADLKEEMKKMSDFECPPKLKTADKVSIQLAAPLTAEGYPVRQSSHFLYCYLPTTVNLGFPYLVNANFLLTPDRAGLLENTWNAYLLELSALTNFYWLKKLAMDADYRDHILKLLGKDSILASPLFKQSYQAGFEQGLQEIPCIPSHRDVDRLLTINDSLVDVINFWREFPELKDKEYPRASLARYELIGLSEQKHFGKRFTANDLWKKLDVYVQKIPDLSEYKRLLLFISHLAPIHHYFSLRPEFYILQNIPFLLCQSGAYLRPEKTYYYPEDHKKTEWPENLHIDCLDRMVTRGEPELIQWLTTLGAKPLTSDEILEHEILPRLQSDRQTVETHLDLFSFVFKQMESITTKDRRERLFILLRKIYVLNVEKNWIAVQSSYFHDDYKPQVPIMTHSKDLSLFLSPLYLNLKLKESALKPFFKNMGVRETLSIERYSPFTYQEALASKNKLFMDYFESFRKHNQFAKANDSISLLINLPILDFQTQGPQFVSAFWKQLIDEWPTLYEECKTVTYRYVATVYGKTQGIQSFLQYRLNNTPCLQANDGQFYPSTQFYPSQFKKLTLLPVLDRELPEGMARFLGLRSRLSEEDCLKLLTYYGEQTSPHIEIYQILFTQMLITAEHHYSFKRKLETWSGKLPAQDGSLQLVKQLKVFDVANQEAPRSSRWFKEIPKLSREKRLQIAELFSIPLFTAEKPLIFAEQERLDSTLSLSFRSLLAVLVLVEARIMESDPAALLNQSLLQLEKLRVYSVVELKICWSSDEKEARSQRCCLGDCALYYKGDWKSKAVEIAKLVAQFLNFSSKTQEAASALIAYPADSEPLLEWLKEDDYSEDEYRRLLELSAAKPQPMEELESKELKSTAFLQIESSQKSKDFSLTLRTTSLPVVSQQPVEEKTFTFHRSSSGIAERIPAPTQKIIQDGRSTLSMTHATPSLSESASSTITDSSSPEIDSLSQSFAKTRLFNPSVQPEEIDMKSVVYKSSFTEQTSLKSKTSTPAPRTVPSRSSSTVPDLLENPAVTMTVHLTQGQDTSEIGRWGEKFVYQKLMADYRLKYPLCTCQETEQGFELKGHRLRDVVKEPLDLQVIWYNKAGETGASADFKIIKNGAVRYVEVKATQQAEKAEFFISSSEWRTLMQHGDRYRLFRVFNAGQPDAYITKIKNPAEKIKSGEWLPQQVRFKG